MTESTHRKSLLLFLSVVAGSSILLVVGWGIGFVFDGIWSLLLAGGGGAVGAGLGSEIGFRKGYFQAEYDARLILGGGFYSFLGVGVLSGAMELPGVLIAAFSVLGAGLGTVAVKYLLRAFVHDPPISIR